MQSASRLPMSNKTVCIEARQGEAGRVTAWRGRPGRARQGFSKRLGPAGQGLAWHGRARPGEARQGFSKKQGAARPGGARLGMAWQGAAGQGFSKK
jgi:hypothetical protein